MWLAIEVEGFHTLEQGYMPGLGTKSWQLKDSRHLWLIGCAIRDVVEEEDEDEEESPQPTELEMLEQIKTRLIVFTDFAEQRIKQWTIGAIVFAALILASLYTRR